MCMDGDAIGMLFEKIQDLDDQDFFITFESPDIIDAPTYKERMFIKLKKNRDLLKKYIEEKEFLDLDKVNMDNNPNTRFIKDMCDDLHNQGCLVPNMRPSHI